MKEINATWKNIEKLMIKIKANCSDAEEYANDAISSAQNAYKYLADLQELLKIRKKYEGKSSNVEVFLKDIESALSITTASITKIRKETDT